VKSLRLAYCAFGEPGSVLRLEEVDVSDKLGEGEVLIELVASPVHPSDIGTISGKYGDLPELPAVGGREGIGRVVGASVSDRDLVGKFVKSPPGAWSILTVARIRDLFFVPDGIDPYQAAMAFVNPLTARMLLTQIRSLKPGDWVIQNAANSAVGVAVIQIAKHMGIKTINLVRNARVRREKLESCGATVIFDSEAFDSRTLPDYAGGERPLLGLNSVGGNSAVDIIKSMAFGGEVVTFGGMVGDKVRFPTRELIFNDLRLRGFWLDKWSRRQTHEKMQILYDTVFAMMRDGILHIPIASTVRLSDGVAALLLAYENRKDGKVLVVP
jgi:NADPH:quinone reductase-like Zn-dependent oxidoreductase